MQRRATSYDVALAAGVAQSTVSRCFKADGPVSSATRAQVQAVAARLGYVPNAMARSLITRRSDMVAVIATRFTMRGNPDLIYALGEQLAAAGKSVMLVTVADDWPDAAALRAALEYPLDGVISCVSLADAVVGQFISRGVGVLFFNRRVTTTRIDWVKTDNAAATAGLATLLHQAGHRRFLCIAGPAHAPVSDERIQGFLARLEALGTRRTPVVPADYSYAGGRAAFLSHNATHRRPDAVFAANDQLALGVLDACRFDLGLSVPADISVVGFDDVPEGSRPAYALSTLRQNTPEMARIAVGLLLRRLAHPASAARRVTVPADLVIRGSARLDRSLPPHKD